MTDRKIDLTPRVTTYHPWYQEDPAIQFDDHAIRDRAYAIWEREGRPNGRERDHWLQAAWELSGEQARDDAAKVAAANMNKAVGNPASPKEQR